MGKSAPGPATPQRIESVDRALLLLGLLNRQRTVSVSQAATELGVAVSTAHRLLSTLRHRGFAVQDAERLYSAGPELIGAAQPVSSLPRLVRALHPHLEELFAEVGETVHVVVPAGTFVRFVDGIEGEQPLRVGLRTGGRMPAHCASGGKATLADLDWPEVLALYPQGLPPWPRAKIRDLPALRRYLEGVRERGYAVNVEEGEAGVCAIGVSVRGPERVPVAGISVAVPSVRFDDAAAEPIRAALGRVRRAAEQTLAAEGAGR
jgi:IclR family acetate operon transcriptional repressor